MHKLFKLIFSGFWSLPTIIEFFHASLKYAFFWVLTQWGLCILKCDFVVWKDLWKAHLNGWRHPGKWLPLRLFPLPFCLFLFFKDFKIYFPREGKEGRKTRKGEKHQCVVASRVPLTGDLAPNPGTCPDWELNWQPFGSQASTQSTEPHQPGLSSFS